jgi:hypothetical protein
VQFSRAALSLAVIAQRSELEAAKLEMGVRFPLTAPGTPAHAGPLFPRGVAPGVRAAP